MYGIAAGLFWNLFSVGIARLLLVERFKNFGFCASRASVTAALAELGLELELSVWARGACSNEGPHGFWSPNQSCARLEALVRHGQPLSPGMPETQGDSEAWFLDCRVQSSTWRPSILRQFSGHL
jgi:hypothetical protein